VLCEECCAAAASEGPWQNALALNSGKQSNRVGEEILSFMDCADAGAIACNQNIDTSSILQNAAFLPRVRDLYNSEILEKGKSEKLC
jgi:hypothetical protein